MCRRATAIVNLRLMLMAPSVLGLRFRFATLRLARGAGRLVSTMTAGSSRMIVPLSCAVLGLWLIDRLVDTKAVSWALTLALYALITYVALALIAWGRNVRRLTTFEEFMDETGRDLGAFAKALSVRVPIEYKRIQRLHRLEETESIAWKVRDERYRSLRATVKAEDVSTFLQSAVTADSAIGIGFVRIPVQAISNFLGRIVRGPRITGTLLNDDSGVVIVAEMVGAQTHHSWHVRLTNDAGTEDKGQERIVHELACRIFTSLGGADSERWRATSAFSNGMLVYRQYLSEPSLGVQKVHLRQAERCFLEALAADQRFEFAHYNLGVVYTKLEQYEAAQQAFLRAIERDPSSAAAYYALARIHYFELKDPETAIEISQRVISCSTDRVEIANGYDLKGLAERSLAERNVDLIDVAIASRRKAVANAWRAITSAELRAGSEERQSGLMVERELISTCMRNLGIAYAHAGQIHRLRADNHGRLTRQTHSVRARRRFRRAARLLRAALAFTPTDAETHSQLGLIYEVWGRRADAVAEFEHASRGEPANRELLGHLAAARAAQAQSNGTPPRPRLVDLALDACRRALDSPTEAVKAGETIELVARAHERLGDLGQARRVREIPMVREAVSEASSDERQLKRFVRRYRAEGRDWATAFSLFVLGSLYLRENRLDEALHRLWEASRQLEKHPGEIRVLGLKAAIARAYRQKDEFESALREAERAVALDPLSLYERRELGEIYFARDEPRSARDAYEAALLLSPDDDYLHWKAGLACWQIAEETDGARARRSLRRAISHFESSLDLTDTEQMRFATHYWLGRLNRKLGAYDRAIPHFRRARKHEAANLLARLFLAECYLHVRAFDACVMEFRSLLETIATPEHGATVGGGVGDEWPLTALVVRVYCGLAVSYTDRGVRLDTAMGHLRHAEAETKRVRDPGWRQHLMAACTECKGQIFLRMGHIDQAIHALQHAASLESRSETHLHLALAYEQQLQDSGAPADAWEAFRRARLQSQIATHAANREMHGDDLLDRLELLRNRLDSWEARAEMTA
jgi:tetratricopeptide (TPR) repeat protein